MEAKLYRKKPIEIEAVQWNGENTDSICKFLGLTDTSDIGPNGFFQPYNNSPQLFIRTFQEIFVSTVGDYIIKGVRGEFYPCKPDIFKMTYEEVDKTSEPKSAIDFYKNYFKKPLHEIVEYMVKINAGSSSLKLHNENDNELIAGVFVVRGDKADKVSKAIDFILDNKDE